MLETFAGIKNIMCLVERIARVAHGRSGREARSIDDQVMVGTGPPRLKPRLPLANDSGFAKHTDLQVLNGIHANERDAWVMAQFGNLRRAQVGMEGEEGSGMAIFLLAGHASGHAHAHPIQLSR